MKKKIAALRQARGTQIGIMEANVACSNEQETKAYNDSKAEAARLAAEADELERLMTEDAAEATIELTRQTDINKIVNTGKLEAAFAAQHIEAGTTIEEFRRLAFDKLAARAEETPTRGHVSMGRDEADTRRIGFSQAILHRAGTPLTDKDPGYQYRGLASRGLFAMAAEICRLNGKNPDSLPTMEVARFAMSTSDFPFILADSANKSLQAGYAQLQSRWPEVAARRTARDFKLQYELQLGTTATFPQVPESGEYKASYLTESRESWKLLTYANKLAFTRQTIINDDLNALTNVPQQLGMKAAMRQAGLVWGVLTANAVLTDGVALCAALTHLNLVTGPGTVINVANLGVMVGKLMAQTDLGGDVIGLQPRFLVVPPALRQIAMQYMSAAFVPTAQSGVNPEAGTMTVIPETRLSAAAGGSDTAWYIFADPGIAPVLIYAYLSGQEGLYSETNTSTDVDGITFTARMDFGVGAVEYRGVQKNDGT